MFDNQSVIAISAVYVKLSIVCSISGAIQTKSQQYLKFVHVTYYLTCVYFYHFNAEGLGNRFEDAVLM